MKAKVKSDVQNKIKRGEVVDIVPEYSILPGKGERIGEIFKLKRGEVVISKANNTEESEKVLLLKTTRENLELIK